MRTFAAGTTYTLERCFTDEDVDRFMRISGDAGRHHVAAGPGGRRVVHGLLTATIPTQLGGELDYLAREMVFEFLRPVFTGDTIRCDMTLVEATHERARWKLRFEGACKNQDGVEVLRLRSHGVVLDEA
ncbi:MAG TPA: enoyl-CoA hydratase [Polyangia bacterium]